LGDKSGIEWTDATWNPITGCDRVSPGCDHCYALTWAKRLKAMGNVRYQHDGHAKTSGPGFGLTLHEDLVDLPLKWLQPRFVFVNSMSDLFHPRVPSWFITRVFETMEKAHQHQFQVLTKRPQRMASILGTIQPNPLPNVWLGTSIEHERYSFRADWLRKTPARLRFLSLEPLLGPLADLDLQDIDWIIAGGESGGGFRPIDLDWVRMLRDKCVAQDIPFFYKQGSGLRPGMFRVLDGKEWNQVPRSRLGDASGSTPQVYRSETGQKHVL
jgi:protein gp37